MPTRSHDDLLVHPKAFEEEDDLLFTDDETLAEGVDEDEDDLDFGDDFADDEDDALADDEDDLSLDFDEPLPGDDAPAV